MNQLIHDWYRPVEDDDVDKYMAAYCNALSCTIQIQRYDKGLYYIGTRRIYLVVNSEGLFMRRGKGFQNAHEFLDDYYKQ